MLESSHWYKKSKVSITLFLLDFERFSIERFAIEFVETVPFFELQKCYLHQNGVEFEEELNGMT